MNCPECGMEFDVAVTDHDCEAYKQGKDLSSAMQKTGFRIYVAGPYGDHNPKEIIQQNVDNADAVSRELLKRGHLPFCPHKMTHHWEDDGGLVLDDFMRLDFSMIRTWADCLLRLPGDSKGSDAEVEFALSLDKPVYYDIDEVPLAENNPMHPGFINAVAWLNTLHRKKAEGGYGTLDDPLANLRAIEVFGLTPVQGIAIRSLDKLVRIFNQEHYYLENGEYPNQGDGPIDDADDFAAYGILTRLFLEEKGLKSQRDK